MLPPVEWYRRPLAYLMDMGCTHYFWGDHDDIYMRDHVQTRLRELDHHDYMIAEFSSILAVKRNDYHMDGRVKFVNQPTGGHASSVAFNFPFAKQLHQSFLDQPDAPYADNVLGELAKSGQFTVAESPRVTTMYLAHGGTVTSHEWVDERISKGKEKRNA